MERISLANIENAILENQYWENAVIELESNTINFVVGEPQSLPISVSSNSIDVSEFFGKAFNFRAVNEQDWINGEYYLNEVVQEFRSFRYMPVIGGYASVEAPDPEHPLPPFTFEAIIYSDNYFMTLSIESNISVNYPPLIFTKKPDVIEIATVIDTVDLGAIVSGGRPKIINQPTITLSENVGASSCAMSTDSFIVSVESLNESSNAYVKYASEYIHESYKNVFVDMFVDDAVEHIFYYISNTGKFITVLMNYVVGVITITTSTLTTNTYVSLVVGGHYSVSSEYTDGNIEVLVRDPSNQVVATHSAAFVIDDSSYRIDSFVNTISANPDAVSATIIMNQTFSVDTKYMFNITLDGALVGSRNYSFLTEFDYSIYAHLWHNGKQYEYTITDGTDTITTGTSIQATSRWTVHGDGSQSSPFLIRNYDALINWINWTNEIYTYDDSHYYAKQTANIDCSITSTPGNEHKYETSYPLESTIEYNGNGYKIENITIGKSRWGYSVFPPLYGFYLYNSIIKNASFTLSTDATFIGTFFSTLEVRSTMYNCHAKNVSIVSSGNTDFQYVGGLVGEIYGDSNSVDKCSARNVSISVSGETNIYTVGGLVGTINGVCEISNCFVTSVMTIDSPNMNSWSYVGSLIGEIDGGSSTIVNCYSASEINVINEDQDYPYTYQMVGSGYYCIGTLTDCYYDSTLANAVSYHGTGLSTANMMMENSYSNWNFTNIWNIEDTFNDGYPQFLFPEFGIVSSNRYGKNRLRVSLAYAQTIYDI